MTTIFRSQEVPIAYAMIAAAKRVRPRRDGQHPFQQYFLYWAAFDNIYTTIAHRSGRRTQLRRNDDGTIITTPNGNVNIPEVITVGEREKMRLALEAFSDDLKHALITHEGTAYFVRRVPFCDGNPIEQDAFGQRVNGVINVNHTTDSQYPVWSPIDIQVYEAYQEDPNEESRNFVAGQIVDLLYTVRNNLMHAGKKFDDANDLNVVKNALPLLELIVSSFTRY